MFSSHVTPRPAILLAALLLVSLAGASVKTTARGPGFQFRDLKESRLGLVVDTAVELGKDQDLNIFLYEKAYLSLFGNGDSLAKHLSAQIAARLTLQGFTVEGLGTRLPAIDTIADSDSSGTALRYLLHVRNFNLSQRTTFNGMNASFHTAPLVSYTVDILDAASLEPRASVEVSTAGVQFLALFEGAVTSAIYLGAGELAAHLSAVYPAFAYAPDSVYASRTLLYFDPIKLLPLVDGKPILRLNLGRQVGKQVYLFKYSQFWAPYKYEYSNGETVEEFGQSWLRVGGGIRLLNRERGGGRFVEFDLNFVRWRFRESTSTYSFTGVQPYLYYGYNYIGTRMFFSLAAGAGGNFGVHRDRKFAVEDIESAVPDFLRYAPVGLAGPILSLDAELAVGFFF